MRVTVRLFAALREAAGQAVVEVDLSDGATPTDVWAALVRRHPALASRRGSLAAAVNRSYAAFDVPLAEGDEVAFIPPVSGG
jgi:MoaE-MoaD fusion protein